MNLPEVIDWQEQEVMDALATFFKSKLKQGVYHVSMAEILKLFGHKPELHHHKQVFEIADISDNHEEKLGMTHEGIYYPMSSYAYH